MSEEFYLPGATTIGIMAKDGAVLASEKRVTFGRGIMTAHGRRRGSGRARKYPASFQIEYRAVSTWRGS